MFKLNESSLVNNCIWSFWNGYRDYGYHGPKSTGSQLSALLAICRPSGCTVVSSIVVVGVCNRSQVRTSKCTCLIFGVSIDLDPG